MSNYILGLSCYYHDNAVALMKEGEIVVAVQEERFSRKKHDSIFPINAIRYSLKSQFQILELKIISSRKTLFINFKDPCII